MAVLFQVLNSVFLFFTFGMGLFLLRGNIFLGNDVYRVFKAILMPAYLILSGVMIGYLISVIRIGKDGDSDSLQKKEKIYKDSFIIGIVIGMILALSYIFI